MKKPDEETKILALNKCKEVWKYYAETGDSPSHHECPFCDYLYDYDFETGCDNCLYPGKDHYRCEKQGEPFTMWRDYSPTKQSRQKSARKMLKLLETIEI